jgi:hypothetical protein
MSRANQNPASAFQVAHVRSGSIASILACRRHFRLAVNLGNAGCPGLTVEISNVGASRPDRTNSRPNYLAFGKLTSIRVWLRAYESAPWISSTAPETNSSASTILRNVASSIRP